MNLQETARALVVTLEAEILSYLVEHPSANDTLEGITEWWLLEQRLRTGASTVHSALEHLQLMGFVVEETRPGGRLTYGVNPLRIDEIKSWLNSHTS